MGSNHTSSVKHLTHIQIPAKNTQRQPERSPQPHSFHPHQMPPPNIWSLILQIGFVKTTQGKAACLEKAPL